MLLNVIENLSVYTTYKNHKLLLAGDGLSYSTS